MSELAFFAIWMPRMALQERLFLAAVTCLLCALLSVRSRSKNRIELRAALSYGAAAFLVVLWWAAEHWLNPSYWERKGELSLIIGGVCGCLAPFLPLTDRPNRTVDPGDSSEELP